MTEPAKMAPLRPAATHPRPRLNDREEQLRRFASETARDRDGVALWALAEAHLTLHGSSGARVSSHTLSAYRHAVGTRLKT